MSDMTDEEHLEFLILVVKEKIPNWQSLSQDELVDRIKKEVTEVGKVTSQKISYANTHFDTYKLLFIGVAIGVIGNLWASILNDLFKQYMLLYVLFLTIATLLSIAFVLDSLLYNVNRDMRDDKFVNFFWDRIRKQKSASNKER